MFLSSLLRNIKAILLLTDKAYCSIEEQEVGFRYKKRGLPIRYTIRETPVLRIVYRIVGLLIIINTI